MSDFNSIGVSRSGAITLGGTSQVLAAANSARRGLCIQNISAEDMWVNPFGAVAAAATAGSYKIVTMGFLTIPTSGAVAVVAATTGSKFTANEY